MQFPSVNWKSAQTLIFTVANCSPCVKQYCLAKNSNENTRNCGYLADPVAAYSGKNVCAVLQRENKDEHRFLLLFNEQQEVSRIYVRNFQHVFFLVKEIAKLEKQRGILRDTGGSRRRL